MVKKGKLQEIFSKALYGDDAEGYSVSYRDFNSVVKISLLEFLKISENFQLVPASRILMIEKNGTVLYSKGQKSVS
ncbi:DUF504 domain-containing protein [Nitrososphaera sp. AFS]|jgi:uncharacterized protein (UPF0248 family)|uniref:DUF504 domain-containing protein n=1 Tax=Nitrososphaera sp. AFS TaxID=2301191 RepID=UPI0013922380|nr:DUF504 domain-containing protein [Nitrososphaera sp. AFS]NAL77122.1 DUF504 domain-containing protein [Nitrososphaera sp. AFS]